jgi:hypothetical protein
MEGSHPLHERLLPSPDSDAEPSSSQLRDLRPGDWCSVDWEERGGLCCNPCWCSPEEETTSRLDCFVQFAYATLCFWFCPALTWGKLYAYSMSQEFAICNHFCCAFWCLPYVLCITRHNLRKKLKIGDTKSCLGWLGDYLLLVAGEIPCPVTFFGCIVDINPFQSCYQSQIRRAVPPEAWDWAFAFFTKEETVACSRSPCIVCV